MKIDRGEYGHHREHEGGIDHESPLDGSPPAIGGIEQGGDALEEEDDDGPWNSEPDGQCERERDR